MAEGFKDITFKGDNGQWGFTFDNRFQDYDAAIEFIGGTDKSEGKRPFDDFTPVNPKSMTWE